MLSYYVSDAVLFIIFHIYHSTNGSTALILVNTHQEFYLSGSLGGLMVSALIFDKGHCVLFLGKMFYSHSASLHPGE